MATLKDITAQRQSYANTTAGFANKNSNLGQYPANMGSSRSSTVLPTGGPITFPLAEADISSLTTGMASMNLHPPSFGLPSKGPSQVSGGNNNFNPLSFAQGQAVWPIHQQHLLYHGGNLMHNGSQPHTSVPQHQSLYSAVPGYAPHAAYGQYPQLIVENSPTTTSFGRRVSSGEMPALMTPRRDSISSNEQDLPSTPYTSYGAYANGIALMDRSPGGIFTHSGTPSPQQLAHQYGLAQMSKVNPPSTISVQLQLLLQQEPAIPRAIPAPSSPLKPLDRSLENKNGETNVYIRGLLPETTDDMLHNWGKRFGDIQSSKSIIDLKTNLCKGFGFIKFYNFDDAEKCIRGFHYLGYEVSFARESFYAKLKKFADEHNTNLYVSNIPRTFNEHELGAVFAPYKVCSSRILRDSNGNGRGVGFARFETREVCEQIIKNYNNKSVSKQGGEEHLIQIRYSDTHEQKMLKQQTAAGRQFRAAEYDLGVAQARGQLLDPMMHADAANDLEAYLRSNAYIPSRTTSASLTGPSIRAWPSRTTMDTTTSHRSSGGVSFPQTSNVATPIITKEKTVDQSDAASRPSTPVQSEKSSSSESCKND